MRKQNIYIFTCILMLALLLLSACGGTSDAEATPTVDTESVIATSIAATMQVMAETQTAQVPPTPESTATTQALPTATTGTSTQPTATLPSVQLPTNCLIAGLASETIPDGTLLARGASFTKEWRITNGGTCAWNTGYKLVFESGDLLGAASETVNLTQSVNSGMSTTVSIKMTAPNSDGTYTGYWMLQSDSGVNVGRFSVSINVGTAPAVPFAVTSVGYYSPGEIEVDCGTTVNIPIYITTDGPGTVRYTISSLLGADKNSDETFTAAGKQTIYYPITHSSGTADLDIDVYISYPNNQTFYLRDVDIKCK